MATETAGKDPLEVLKQKVGPLPLWAWTGAAVVIWWYLQRKQAPKTTAGGTAPNQQVDPAGNVGTIDPATGYVSGSPEDQAAIAAQDNTGAGGSAGQNATTGGQKYADNNTWGIAAVNYLVGTGIDGTIASQAIQAYLNSQVLTSAQQGLVNLAIQWLGAPPTLPSPATGSGGGTGGGTGGGGDTGGGGSGGGTGGGGGDTGGGGSSGGGGSGGGSSSGTSSIANPRVVSNSNGNVVVVWTPVGPATSWNVTRVGPGSPNGITNHVTGPQATYENLARGHNYEIRIQPLPSGNVGGIDFKTN